MPPEPYKLYTDDVDYINYIDYVNYTNKVNYIVIYYDLGHPAERRGPLELGATALILQAVGQGRHDLQEGFRVEGFGFRV